MKTKEELSRIKEEIEDINRKLKELTPEELKEVAGGSMLPKEDKVTAVEWLDV